MPRSIRAKIMLLFMGGMTLIIALLVIFTAQQAREQYQMLYLERGETAAEDLSNRANHLFALGLRLDEFIGFEKQCNEIVIAHQGIAEIRLLDAHGHVAFSSSYPSTGPVIWIQRPLSKQPEATRGSVRVAVDRRMIDSQVRSLVTRILIGGFLAMGLGTLLLMYVLNNNLGDPVRRLIRHIRETGPKHLQKSPKDLSDRGDELGTIAQAFDDMAERLSSTQDALLNANEALSNHAKLLEQRVEESTRELRNANRNLKNLANTDALTGLPNRLAFMTSLEERLQLASQQHKPLAVFMLDLDGFKSINDHLGHDMGDYALTVVARRVQGTLRETDSFSRLGGDEFVLIAEDFSHPDDLIGLANRLEAVISQPFRRDGPDVSVGASIGIAVLRHDADETPDSLLKAADKAMYEAKRGNKAYAFSPSVRLVGEKA